MGTPKALSIALLFLAASCSIHGDTATSTASGSPSGSPLAGPSGGLDAAVPVPAGFPADVPVYPNARLTAGASFGGSGQVTWGMEWETLDHADKVETFYAQRLQQGDWTITSAGFTNGVYAAVFHRVSNSHSTGTLGIDGSSPVTKISLSLVNSG